MNSQIFIKSANYNLIHDSRLPLILQMCQISVFLYNNRVVNLIGRVKLGQWPYTLPRSCTRCRNYFALVIAQPKAVGSPNPSTVVVRYAVTRSTGHFFQVMAQSGVDKIPPGPKLDALTAEKVFGWKKVHKHQGALVGRKQDKAGHWRRAKVPNYSTNPLHYIRSRTG